MHFGNIKFFDVADGEGVRVSLFVSGCSNRCKDCFQPETWDFSYGKPFTAEEEDKIIKALEPEFIAGLSLLGGEPFEFSNQKALLPFVTRVKEIYPDKNIWAYTGYVLEDLLEGGKQNQIETLPLLKLIDVLVDGPFISEKKNITLSFRGSSNQRVIDLPKTLKTGSVVLYPVKR